MCMYYGSLCLFVCNIDTPSMWAVCEWTMALTLLSVDKSNLFVFHSQKVETAAALLAFFNTFFYYQQEMFQQWNKSGSGALWCSLFTVKLIMGVVWSFFNNIIIPLNITVQNRVVKEFNINNLFFTWNYGKQLWKWWSGKSDRIHKL